MAFLHAEKLLGRVWPWPSEGVGYLAFGGVATLVVGIICQGYEENFLYKFREYEIGPFLVSFARL